MRRDEGHCDVDISSVSFAKHLSLICPPGTHSTHVQCSAVHARAVVTLLGGEWLLWILMVFLCKS